MLLYVLFGHEINIESNSNREQPRQQEKTEKKSKMRAAEQESATEKEQQQNAKRRKWQINGNGEHKNSPPTSYVHQIDLWKLIIILLLLYANGCKLG